MGYFIFNEYEIFFQKLNISIGGFYKYSRLKGGAVDAYVPMPILHLHDYQIIRI